MCAHEVSQSIIGQLKLLYWMKADQPSLSLHVLHALRALHALHALRAQKSYRWSLDWL